MDVQFTNIPTTITLTLTPRKILALENLDFALVLGVPKHVLNNFDEAAERAAERAGAIVADGAEGYDLDVTDIEIQI